MKVKSDTNAYMQIESINDEFGSIGGANGRTYRVKLRNLNDDAVTKIGELFEIRAHSNLSQDYKYWITLNKGNEASGLNSDSEGNRVVRFDWYDADAGSWKPLNTKNNSEPSDVPELSSGESVKVRLTVDLRHFEPDSGVAYGESYKLLKQAIIHSAEV